MTESQEVVLVSYDYNFIRGVEGMTPDKIRFTADSEVYEIDLDSQRWQVKTDYTLKCEDKPFLCYKKDSSGVRFLIRDNKGTKIYNDVSGRKIMRL